MIEIKNLTSRRIRVKLLNTARPAVGRITYITNAGEESEFPNEIIELERNMSHQLHLPLNVLMAEEVEQ